MRNKKIALIAITGVILTLLIICWCIFLRNKAVKIIVPQELIEQQVRYENDKVYVDSQLLLTASHGVKYRDVEKKVKEEKGEIIGYISFSNDYQIYFPHGLNYEELNKLIVKWEQDSFCQSVTLHNVYRLDSEFYNRDPWLETDSKKEETSVWNEAEPKGNNWWAEAVRMPTVWDSYDWEILAKEAVKIGVIDSVFDEQNKELENVFKKTWQNTILNQQTRELFGEQEWKHGTHVSGIIAAELGNNYGISGVAACAKPELYGYAYLGNAQHQYSSIMQIKYAIAVMLKENVKIINMSIGYDEMLFAAQQGNEDATKNVELFKEQLTKFLKEALKKGYDFVIVKAAGNQSGDYWMKCKPSMEHPYGYKKNEWGQGEKVRCSARYDYLGAITDKEVKSHIIMVGAAEQSFFSETVGGTGYIIADYSNSDCDVYAPGTDILSAIPMNGIEFCSGTSMATPIVTGIAALVWTVNPELSGKQVKEIIATSANYQMIGIDPVLDFEITRKNDVVLVNAAFAVNLATIEKGEAIKNNKDCVLLMGRVCCEEEGEKKYIKNVEINISKDENSDFEGKVKSDEMGDIQIFLTPGKYKICAKDEKYGTAELEIDVEETKITYLEIILKKNWDIDKDNYKQLYGNIINECKNRIDYNDLDEKFQKKCNGLIEDLNNDGIRELILNYCIDSGYCCEIWTIKNSKTVRIFNSGLYFDDLGIGGYLDLMKFCGKTYLTQFDRVILNGNLNSECWIFYELTENEYEVKHELSCFYDYDERKEIPVLGDCWLDDRCITEEEFFDVCPEKIADIINLDGDYLNEDLLNSVSSYGYDVCFEDREITFDELLQLLEELETIPLKDPDLLLSFINNKSYEKYIDCYYGEPSEYAIIDIGETESKELIISSNQDFSGFINTLIFSYDDETKEIFLVDRIYHFLELRFSERHKAFEYSEFNSTQNFGESGFYVIVDGKLEPLFYVGWDSYEKEDFNYIRTENTCEEITAQQKNEYFEEVKSIVYTPICQ